MSRREDRAGVDPFDDVGEHGLVHERSCSPEAHGPVSVCLDDLCQCLLSGELFDRGPAHGQDRILEIVRVARSIWKYSGRATVDGQVAAEADLMCTLRAIEPGAAGQVTRRHDMTTNGYNPTAMPGPETRSLPRSPDFTPRSTNGETDGAKTEGD